MAWRVDKVKHITLAVRMRIKHAHGRGLNGNAAFPFDIHGVQELVFHVPKGHGIGELHHPIRKGRFSVIDMGDDAEIANQFPLVSHPILHSL
ncbi:hypothetical protein SDC9_187140 [bioreactor metagenome]|uniref:Uncharacterized protein n=1 Tax=bioreactor metagenome TaxID=1076179 RepID=A0A645HME1_9ZZZZ